MYTSLPEIRARLFCVNESHLHTTSNELGNEGEEWLLLFSHLNIKVFDVSGSNPKHMLHGLYT